MRLGKSKTTKHYLRKRFQKSNLSFLEFLDLFFKVQWIILCIISLNHSLPWRIFFSLYPYSLLKHISFFSNIYLETCFKYLEDSFRWSPISWRRFINKFINSMNQLIYAYPIADHIKSFMILVFNSFYDSCQILWKIHWNNILAQRT